MEYNDQPVVSICCITYNHEPYIRQAIEGFLMQKTSFPIEVIIHDDASTDNTATIIREYQALHPEIIKPIFQTENQWSKGIKPSPTYVWPKAKGKYIALCEGDDYWTDPLKLTKQIQILEQDTDFAIVHTNYNTQAPDGSINLSIIQPLNEYNLEYLIQYNCIRTATVLFRNSKNLADGFQADLPYGDWPLFLNCARQGKIKYLNDITAVYRTNVGITSSASFSTPIQNRIKVINWFIRYNPAFKKAGSYSKYVQYSILIEKGNSNLNEIIYPFLKCYFKSWFFDQKLFQKNVLTTLLIFTRKYLKQLIVN